MLYGTLGEHLNHILLITNGSRNKNLYRVLARLAKFVNISINVSIHTDHVDMAHILELIENLSADIKMHFAIMFNPDKREFVHEIYDMLLEYRKKYWFGMAVTMLRDGARVDPRYISEDFAWNKAANEGIRKLVQSVNLSPPQNKSWRGMHLFTDTEENGEKKTLTNVDYNLKYSNGLILFRGMYCMAHAALLSVSADGRCRGMVCGDDPIICNIHEKDSLLAVRDKLIHPVKCKQALCGCSSNYRIPKFASEEEAKKYTEFAQKRQAELFDEYLVSLTQSRRFNQ